MEAPIYGKKMFLLSLVSTTVFAAVLSFFPQYYAYLLIAYFILMPMIMIKFMSKHIKEMKGPKGGRTIVEVDARDLFDSDPQGGEILKAQAKMNLLNMLPFLVLIALAFTLWPMVEHIEDPWMRFLAIFTYFESYTVINYLINRHNLKTAKNTLRPIYQYKVTDKGIHFKPFGGISFPLKDYEVKVVEESKAVDLISKKEGQPSYRIYFQNPRELYEIIRRHGGIEEA